MEGTPDIVYIVDPAVSGVAAVRPENLDSYREKYPTAVVVEPGQVDPDIRAWHRTRLDLPAEA